MANAFALLRLLPMSAGDKDREILTIAQLHVRKHGRLGGTLHEYQNAA